MTTGTQEFTVRHKGHESSITMPVWNCWYCSGRDEVYQKAKAEHLQTVVGRTFSEDTVSLLKKAGWSEDRFIYTAPLEAVLTAAGWPVFPCVKEFLGEFGNLSIQPPPPVPDVLRHGLDSVWTY